MTRRLAFLLGIMIPSFIGFLFAVSQLPYEPEEPLTLETGRTLQEFTAFARRQFGPPIAGGVKAQRSRPAHPRQTYGNRARRWLMGRPLGPDSISLDYVLRGENLYLLFEVRFTQESEGRWRISYFQSHAG